mmetsp:Transcript_12974/g.30781  ORF Transcript_12974/g.30781 Transcript_12974/m.30781 type:complete len:305 (+) Transcript_12974:1121-2035(+)
MGCLPRQPAPPSEQRHLRHHLLRGPQGGGPWACGRLPGVHPDGRLDQPGQQRRAPHQPRGRGHRRDVHEGPRSGRRQLCHPDRHGQERGQAALGAGPGGPPLPRDKDARAQPDDFDAAPAEGPRLPRRRVGHPRRPGHCWEPRRQGRSPGRGRHRGVPRADTAPEQRQHERGPDRGPQRQRRLPDHPQGAQDGAVRRRKGAQHLRHRLRGDFARLIGAPRQRRPPRHGPRFTVHQGQPLRSRPRGPRGRMEGLRAAAGSGADNRKRITLTSPMAAHSPLCMYTRRTLLRGRLRGRSPLLNQADR